MTHAARPVPVPDEQSAPYWQAAAEHVLTVARCSRCGTYAIPIDITCNHCLSPDPQYAFEKVSGKGKIRSWTVIRQSFLPGFEDDLPFLLVDVELDEQDDLRMVARLLEPADAPLRLGARVRVAFEDLANGVAIPAFAPDES